MTAGRSRTSAVIWSVVVVTLITGCTTEPQGEDPDMDYPTAVAEMTSLMTAVQDLIGGEWDQLDSGAEPCPLPSGDTGAQAPFGRFGHGVPAAEQEALAEQATTIWTEAGFAPVQVEEPKSPGEVGFTLAYPETGYGQDRVYLRLTVTERGSNVEGQTRCVVGDPDELAG